ncbi:MAG TPA: PilZ domain-containing protein [Bryobacteraceae bacterium]|nr:PilZ domain-containing protein [Bryobacteraceae bacterium]
MPAYRPRRTSPKPTGENRQGPRFPMPLPLHYRLAEGSGWGRVLNIGKGGALFTIGHMVKPGQRIELRIGWPVLLDEKVHLTLVAGGVIVRAEDGQAAVRFHKCWFRTATAEFKRQALMPNAESQHSFAAPVLSHC